MEYKILIPDDKKYPEKLKNRLDNNALKKLYYTGRLENLNRFTIAILCSNEYSGTHLQGMFEPLKVIEKYEVNFISGFMSGLEHEIFRLALRKRPATLTLFSEKGLGIETFDSHFATRFPPPFDSWWGKDEYFRQAKELELLMLTVVEPEVKKMERKNIIERNFFCGVLADAVFVPCAPKGSKTYAVTKRLIEIDVPVFTVFSDDNEDVYELGIPAFAKDTKKFIEKHGAKIHNPGKSLKLDEYKPEKVFKKEDDTQTLMRF